MDTTRLRPSKLLLKSHIVVSVALVAAVVLSSAFGHDEAQAPTNTASTVGQPAGAVPTESATSPTSVSVATAIDEGVHAFPRVEAKVPLMWFPNPTAFGGERVFLVTDADSDPDRIEVLLPVQPNGRTGWVERSAVTLSPIDARIEIDLTRSTVTAWSGGEELLRASAAIGRAETPTPTGLFYIRDVIAQEDAAGPYGSWIVALSGFSEVLDSFDGGLPGLAIHGTPDEAELGAAVSAGCVRIGNEQIAILAGLPLGTPVMIVA